MKKSIITCVLLLLAMASCYGADREVWTAYTENVGKTYVLYVQGPAQLEKYAVLSATHPILHASIAKSGAYVAYILPENNGLYVQVLKTGARHRVSSIESASGQLSLNENHLSYTSESDHIEADIGSITSSSVSDPFAGMSDAVMTKLDEFGEIFLKIKYEYVDVVPDYKLMDACKSGMGVSEPSWRDEQKPDAIKSMLDAKLAVIGLLKAPAANIPHDAYESKLLACTEAMVESLDRLSYYMYDDWPGYRTSANKLIAGIGVNIELVNEEYLLYPLPGGSAMAAGLPKHARLLSIDHTPVAGLSARKVTRLLVGPPRSKVDIEFKLAGSDQTSQMAIERNYMASMEPISVEWLPDGLLYLRIARFHSKISEQLSKRIEQSNKDHGQDPKGIILDLRSNGGGLLSEAVGVDAIFLPKDQLVIKTIGRSKDSNLLLRTNRSDFIQNPQAPNFIDSLPSWRLTAPMAVLINQGSAGASDLVAAALQHYNRAVLVGQASSGDGTLQSIFPMHNGRAIKVTTARYYSPSGEGFAAGIKPSIEVPSDGLEEEKHTDRIVGTAAQHLLANSRH